jgi:hypothetical protein
MRSRGKPLSRFHTFLILALILVPALSIFVLIGISLSRQKAFCTSLAANREAVQAQVVNLQLYDHRAKANYVKVTDITKANEILMQLQYSVNGQPYTKELLIFYENPSYFTKAYDLARTGVLDLVYLPGKPEKVRPALEFEKGASADLCAGTE